MTCLVRRWSGLLLASVLGTFCGCANNGQAVPDHPQLTPGTKLQDLTFPSSALHREMKYRVILPEAVGAERKLPVVYLLHGGGGGFRDWSDYSDVAKYANHGLLLIMPEGNSSYTNSASVPADRYQDYITKDRSQTLNRASRPPRAGTNV